MVLFFALAPSRRPSERIGGPFPLFSEAVFLATKHSHRRPATPTRPTLHQPQGYFPDRVQRAGPEPFGLACFDGHPDYSQWMLADFFGSLLLPPRRRDPTRQALDDVVAQ